MADVAPLLLPKSVRRVLSSKIEVAPDNTKGTLRAAVFPDVVLVEQAEEDSGIKNTA